MRIRYSIVNPTGTATEIVIEPACLALYMTGHASDYGGPQVKPMVANGRGIEFADEITNLSRSGEFYEVILKEIY
jgi:hypothetical protein